MKKYLITALFISLISCIKAQNISLKELINFRTMNISTLSDNLLSKNFNYVGIMPDPLSNEDLYTWAYNFDVEEKTASAWVHKFTLESKDGIAYATSRKTSYLQFKKEMEQNGFKLINTTNGEKGALISEYVSNNYFISINTQTTSPSWIIFLRKK